MEQPDLRPSLSSSSLSSSSLSSRALSSRVPTSRVPMSWTIRRAGLLDVPAVARLLEVPGGVLGTSATRLILTHVGLDLGEFWVAVDDADHVLAAVVLLPAGDDGHEQIQLALRLELGLLLKPSLQESLGGGVPQAHWLLLPAVPPGYQEELLPDLLAATMPAIEASGLPVLSLQYGPPAAALRSAGFEPLEETLVLAPGSASLRVVPDPGSLGN